MEEDQVRVGHVKRISDQPYGTGLAKIRELLGSGARTNTHGSNPAQRMQYEGAQLPEAPGFSPYRLGSSMYVGECPTPLS